MNDPDFRQRLRATFQTEASEHLRALSTTAFALESARPEEHPPLVEQMFRETHTLKGAARMVGENEAESLCHALEQRLSGWKSNGRAVACADISQLHREIGEIARTLHLPLETAVAPTPAVAPAATSGEPAPTAPAPGRLRVPAARLDALLLRAEELVSAKMSGDQHVAMLRAFSERGLAWKKEAERVRADVATLRRFVDAAPSSPVVEEMGAVLHYLDWTHEFLRELHGDVGKLAKSADLDQRRLGFAVEQLLQETKEVLLQPFSSLLEVFPGFVREIAQQQGKAIALVTEGGATEIDRRVLEEMKDALLHLVRNSIDHGIEPSAERRALGKPEEGRLSIAVQSRSGGNVEIAVSDDGRGIDPAEVTASARRLGLIASDAPDLPDHDALALLFHSGFSTRAEPTSLSGRGLGLAIVREKAEQMGGSVSIESERGRGTTFRIQVPLTLARFRGLFVSAQKQTFVVPAAYVARVVRIREQDIRRVKAQEVVTLDGGAVALLPLAEVLGLAGAAKKPNSAEVLFAVLLDSGRSRIALRVDDVPSEEEIVMKSLGRMLHGARQYVGAAVTGGGRIVPVLNVGHLMGAAAQRGHSARAPRRAAAKPVERRKRTILVVEDSITSRSLLKSILQSAGYEVRTAVDGVDGLTILKFEPIDLVITDVQMPRMDGFELTARIRADSALSTLPVVLITSLASREDRERGVDAGANAYIVKSSFDQSDLLEALGRLLP